MNKRVIRSTPYTIQKRNNLKEWWMIWTMLIVFSLQVNSSRQEALLYLFEDHEAVIGMIMGGRTPAMRHVFWTHGVAFDWLFDRINLDSKIQIKYIDTKNQLADTLTEGNFTRDEWNHVLCLFNISHFSSTDCSEVMSKRTKKDSGEERVTEKSKTMMNLVSSTASESPVKTRHESQQPLSSWNEQHQRTGRLFSDAYSSNYSVACWQELVFSTVEIWWWKLEHGDLFMNSHLVCSDRTD